MDILHEAWPTILLSFLGLAGVVGLLALVSPKMFAIATEAGGTWVTAPKFESVISIDQFVIRHSRRFGALVLMVDCYLIPFFLGHIDPSWTPAFLLLMVSFSVLFALSGLIELGGAVSKIEIQLADARIDALTGLANRRVLDEELERRLSEKSRKGAGFCVAMLDIDHFKKVNDNVGHLTGDTVLTKGVTEVIRNTKRTMDLAARYGGDEFVIIYPANNLSEASTAVELMRTAIASTKISLEDAEVAVTVSIGVAEAADGDDVVSLLQRVDDALYAAKEAGRNRGYRHNGESCEPIIAEELLVTVA